MASCRPGDAIGSLSLRCAFATAQAVQPRGDARTVTPPPPPLLRALGTARPWKPTPSAWLLQEASLEPDVKYMNMLIEALGCNGDLRSALAALADLRAAGLAPDAGTVQAAVRACLACGDIPRARSMYCDFAEVRTRSCYFCAPIWALPLCWLLPVLCVHACRCLVSERRCGSALGC